MARVVDRQARNYPRPLNYLIHWRLIMAKDIEEVKKAKIDLESKILSLIQEFEKTNGVKLGYIETTRERPKSTRDGYHPSECMPEEFYDDLPYADVQITLRIE
jgi:hypothetical protein